MEKKLPKNWVNAKLNDLSNIQSGGTPSRSKKQYWSGDIPWVKISDLKEWYVKSTTEFITEEGLNNSSTKKFPKGTILFTIFASIGKVGVLDIEACTNQAIAGITPVNEIKHKFLTYSLIELSEILRNQGKGVAQKNINLTILKDLNVPLPPLAEQQRIVAKLDQLFGHLDHLKTRLNNIPQILKNFRQAVLTQAVTGKLTEEWRVGKELEEWRVLALKNITTKIGSGSTPKGGSESYKEEGIPLVRSMNIHFNGIKIKGLAFIDEIQAERLKNVEIEENDILLNITGASIGRVCLAEKNIVGGRVNQHVNIIRLNKDNSPQYVNMYLASSLIQNYIFNENYGVTRQALTKTQTQNLKINIPPKQEQTEIVKRVEHLFAKADTIETQYQSLKTKIDSLPQAILAKAFKGELVAQLPTDGDAKELLEEIKRLKKKINTKLNYSL